MTRGLLFLILFLAACQAAPEKNVETESTPAPAVTPPVEVLIPPVKAFLDSLKYNGEYAIINWKMLAKMSFKMMINPETSEHMDVPLFSPELQALDGKKVQIQGYVIPFEETGDDTFIVLSAFPYSQCFFCGNAGPESVVDILPAAPLSDRLKVDDQMTFRGKLKLNDSDFDYLNYILESAEIVE